MNATTVAVDQVKLLPAQYVRAYVKRNKTDAADAAALLEADRTSDIGPVRVKSVEQQALQGLHRIRSLWMGTRRPVRWPTSLREFVMPRCATRRCFP